MKVQQGLKAVLLSSAFALTLVGCGKAPTTEQAAPAAPQAATQTQPTDMARYREDKPTPPPSAKKSVSCPKEDKKELDEVTTARHATACETFKAAVGTAQDKLAAKEMTAQDLAQAKVEAALQYAQDRADTRIYSAGKRAVTKVTKFSVKGSEEPVYTEGQMLELCKSGEGEAELPVATTNNSLSGTEAGKTTQVFKFSVSKNDKKVIDDMLAAVDSGHEMSLSYNQMIEGNRCETRTDYRVTAVEDITAKAELKQNKKDAASLAAQQKIARDTAAAAKELRAATEAAKAASAGAPSAKH